MPNSRKVVFLGSVVLGVLALRRCQPVRRVLRRTRHEVAGRVRYLDGRLRGLGYRLARQHPDEDVSDLVLADRIRSSLGPVERQLDLPHIHVMVQDHVALLHGDVATEDDREILEGAVADVRGVDDVESFLHVGLLAGDTRPSEGRTQRQPSDAYRSLNAAASRAGAAGRPVQAVRAVLAGFCERIPAGERRQLLAHLPDDVRSLAEPPRRRRAAVTRIRTVDELADTVAAADPDLDPTLARPVTEAVLGQLAVLVPEERADLVAILPGELRRLWERAVASVEAGATAHVEVSAAGDVTDGDRAYAAEKIGKVLETIAEPVLQARVRLDRSANPAHERPASARVTIDINGEPVRAHVMATTMNEAVDLLEARLSRRVDDLAEHRRALQRRGPTSPRGEWHHGDLPTHRQKYLPRPVEEREVVRHKTFSTPDASVDEAIFDLEAMDYDFFLFTDRVGGQDALVYRLAGGCYGVQYLEGPTEELGPAVAAAVQPADRVAPELSLPQAQQHLDVDDQPWLFFKDPSSGRGHVLYRRYDGHYGLITPAGESVEQPRAAETISPGPV